MEVNNTSDRRTPRDQLVSLGEATLYVRESGAGRPIVALHGGPDFDHGYMFPELDRLSDRYRLIAYDQRGRGRSAEGVRADDVSLASDVEDLELLRTHLRVETMALLGHSWGCCSRWNMLCGIRPAFRISCC